MLQILADTLAPGTVVPGGFRLERIVGEGGMGVVWAARHGPSGRVVALKFLREGRESDPRNQERFLREARASMAVVHPNVARVEAVLETEAGVPFLVMELLEGESLRNFLRRRGVLNPVETAQIMTAVVEAVAHAHAMRIVHRDLKPENIYLLPGPHGPQIRVLDFGIAKQLAREGTQEVGGSLTSTGAMIGTPLYMAPEQVFADVDVDGRVDCWALGIIIYECLAGETPTEAPGFGPILKRITTDPIVPLERMRPGLPGKITRLVARMLLRDRMQRPPLAEVRAVLAEVIAAGDGAMPSAPMMLPLRLMPDATTNLGLAHTGQPTPKKSNAPLVIGIIAGVVILGGAATAAAIIVPPMLDKGSSAAAPGDERALLMRAADAAKKRDGKTCLSLLDQYDTIPGRTTNSKSPTDGATVTRAMCTMLVGDCEGGKALYKSWSVAVKAPDAEQSAEGLATSYCQGDKLSQRDELLRANAQVMQSSTGTPKPTIAQCKDWSGTVKRLQPLVKPKDKDDYGITSIPDNFPNASALCFAQAGDCNAALGVFREGFNARYAKDYPDPKLREQLMRGMYDSLVPNTSCKGKP